MNGKRILAIGIVLACSLVISASAQNQPQSSEGQQGAAGVARSVGTVQSVNGKTLVLKPDTGAEITVSVQDGARLLRLAPGQTDLKSATPITLQDIQVGDR